MNFNNTNFPSPNSFSRYTSLDTIEWNCISHLLNSTSKHAENIWKLLADDTQDALFKPLLTREEKTKLIYMGTDMSTTRKVFMLPYIDDKWDNQGSRIDIYVDRIVPQNHLTSVVNVVFEVICHNKVLNIYSDADPENPNFCALWDSKKSKKPIPTNPLELKKVTVQEWDKFIDANDLDFIEMGGNYFVVKSGSEQTGYEIVTLLKNRATTLVKCLLALFNGTMVNGVGQFIHDTTLSPYAVTKSAIWGSGGFVGHIIVMSSLISGVSQNANLGY